MSTQPVQRPVSPLRQRMLEDMSMRGRVRRAASDHQLLGIGAALLLHGDARPSGPVTAPRAGAQGQHLLAEGIIAFSVQGTRHKQAPFNELQEGTDMGREMGRAGY